MGRSRLVQEACNGSAPDTGNMEVLQNMETNFKKKNIYVL